MDTIPVEVTANIFSFLSYQQIAKCSLVCKSWSTVPTEGFYKRFCKKYFLVNAKEGETWKGTFRTYYQNFGRYIDCYKDIKQCWNVFESKLGHFCKVEDGLSEDTIDMYEKTLGFPLPKEVRCSFRIHDGQVIGDGFGLFGGYQFYDYITHFFLLNLKTMVSNHCSLRENSKLPTPIKSSLALCYSPTSREALFIAIGEDGGQKYGEIYQSHNSFIPFPGYFPIANSFTELLQNHARRIENGDYEITEDEGLTLFMPTQSDRTTNGVRIQVRTVFVPKLSNLQENENANKFHFSYKICISMSENESVQNSCTLMTRSWRIQHPDNRIETVNGPGVIGLYPEIRPGTVFQYASCNFGAKMPIIMSGSFQMRNNLTGEIFDAIVDPFEMKVNYISPQRQKVQAFEALDQSNRLIKNGKELFENGLKKESLEVFDQARTLTPFSADLIESYPKLFGISL